MYSHYILPLNFEELWNVSSFPCDVLNTNLSDPTCWKANKCALTTAPTSSVTLTNTIVEMLMAANATKCNFWFHEERMKEFGPIIIFYHLNIKIPVRIGLIEYETK